MMRGTDVGVEGKASTAPTSKRLEHLSEVLEMPGISLCLSRGRTIDGGQIREGLKGKGKGPPEGHSSLGVFAGVVGKKSKNLRLNMALLR